MTDDLVKRLRQRQGLGSQALCEDAADEIERLRAALDSIRFATGAMPEGWNHEASWYKSRFYDCVATAAKALRDD